MLALYFALALLIVGVSAFSPRSALKVSSIAKTGLYMDAGTSPGRNLKPTFDGTFKEAGAHLEQYVLEHENGSRAVVDTKTATAITWKKADGKELITSKNSVHKFNGATLKGEFVPEERAKKVSFDRMIFKTNPTDLPQVEYRVDVTLREDSLEYDVTIKNSGADSPKIKIALDFNVDGSVKVTKKTGYTESTDKSVTTAEWSVPVGKFKETGFYALVK